MTEALNPALQGPPAALIAQAITYFILGFAALGLIFGFSRGFSKSVIRLITIALSAVGSLMVMNIAFDFIDTLIYGMSIEELILKYVPFLYDGMIPENWQNLIACFDAETAQRLIYLISGIILFPVIFLMVFYLLKAVSMIIYWILTAITGASFRRKSFTSRLLGALVGAAQGSLIAAIILLPIAGYSNLAKDAKAILTADGADPETKSSVEEFYGWWLDDAIESPALSAIYSMGGEAFFNSVTTVSVGGEDVNMQEQMLVLVQIAKDAIPLKSTDFTAPDEESKENMKNIAADVADNEFTASIICGILRGAATAVDRGALLVPAEEPFKSLIIDTLAIFETSSPENIHADLDTLLDVYFILGDTGTLEAFGGSESVNVADALIAPHEEGTAIEQITTVLYENVRTRPLVTTLTKISVAIMCDSMGIDQDATELYNDVKGSMNEVLTVKKEDYGTEEEYVDALSDKLDVTLREHDIILDEAIVENMAEYVAENFSEQDELTDDEINDILLSYYDAYKNSLPPVSE